MSAEIYSLCDGMDTGLLFSLELRGVVENKFPVRMITASKSLFDTITKRSQTKEKRFLIDSASVRDVCRAKKIEDVAWIHSEHNIADEMTNEVKNFTLVAVLDGERLDDLVGQWNTRK